MEKGGPWFRVACEPGRPLTLPQTFSRVAPTASSLEALGTREAGVEGLAVAVNPFAPLDAPNNPLSLLGARVDLGQGGSGETCSLSLPAGWGRWGGGGDR